MIAAAQHPRERRGHHGCRHLLPSARTDRVARFGPTSARRAVARADRAAAPSPLRFGGLPHAGRTAKVLAPNLGASNGASDWDQASGVITIPASAVQRILPVSPHPDTARNGVGAATASHPRPLPNLYKTPQSRCSLRKRLPIRVADGRHIGHERPASGAKR